MEILRHDFNPTDVSNLLVNWISWSSERGSSDVHCRPGRSRQAAKPVSRGKEPPGSQSGDHMREASPVPDAHTCPPIFRCLTSNLYGTWPGPLASVHPHQPNIPHSPIRESSTLIDMAVRSALT